MLGIVLDRDAHDILELGLKAGFKDIRLFAHDDSADRNAACQTLSHRDDVGFDFSPLMSEPLAGATHAALDFVAHHQEVVFVTDFTDQLSAATLLLCVQP